MTTYNVLVVDYNPSFAQGIEKVLKLYEGAELQIGIATSPEQARQMAAKLGGIDVLLSDTKYRGEDYSTWPGLAKELKKLNPNMYVVGMSAAPNADVYWKQAGFIPDAFIEKGFEFDDLYTKLDNYFASLTSND